MELLLPSFPTMNVFAVQKKFGTNLDTDKLLGELVKVQAELETKPGPVTTLSVLVPRGEVRALEPKMHVPVTPQSGEEGSEDENALRPIVIDGSNVAMSHGNKQVFSCLGIQLAVNYFLDRGHTQVTVFVPSWRKEQPRPDVPITDQQILLELESKKNLVFTPSRHVAGKRVVCNDDFYIVQLAYDWDGVVVSNDMYRDLQREKPEWKRFIDERLLMYSFVNDKFMPPDDPLGRHGPTLVNFLRRFPKSHKKQSCPYGKKCTFGIKCKYSHPERGKQSNRLLADTLRENAKLSSMSESALVPGQSLSLVEEMARKLTLAPEPSKKDHKSEKSKHSSSKKGSSRKEKSPPERAPPQHSRSQERLDSGLGSIDGPSVEAPRGHFEPPFGGTSACPVALQQQHYQMRNGPCNCCSPLRSSPAYPHHHSTGSDAVPHYPPYDAYRVSMPPFSQPASFQHSRHHHHHQPVFLSEPYGVRPVLPCEPPPWDPPLATQPSRNTDQRTVIRTNLLAIFSAHLVDAAMDRFPQVNDPQKLAAEIVNLQNQNRSR
ncbi:endoribonuclease ZC3H12A isoform X2 [Synchiropus splendidus]|uniref:endoribonuclease ZC3H12A isoform X2 n=1 Tax=Synchiropus splendidus TaxID=270530 RepID=UPI00237E116A|nr:endoribonuclease ZC3H12A isoform X2 [Synchiropus splendidus]